MVVILDNVRSLHNVGSIFRTADALGVEKVYLCGITPKPLDRFGAVPQQLAKVALGAEKSVPWEHRDSTVALLTRLKKQGFTLYALEQALGSVSTYAVRPTIDELRSCALIVGAEVEGVSPQVLKKCDKVIEIPMAGKKESLNVSVAFGVAAYQLTQSQWSAKH